MTLDEWALVLAAKSAWFKATSADWNTVLECGEMNLWANQALSSINFKVSTFDSPDHDGLAYPGLQLAHVEAHIFKDLYLGNGQWRIVANEPILGRRLLQVYLHEAAHGWGGKRHLTANGDLEEPPYASPYFKHLNFNYGDETSCLN